MFKKIKKRVCKMLEYLEVKVIEILILSLKKRKVKLSVLLQKVGEIWES